MRVVVTAIAVVVVVGLQGACEPAPSSVPRACNGDAALCDRSLDEVTFAGAHNAMSSRDDGFLGPNQTLALPGQLRLGVRAFMLDTYPAEPGRSDDGVRLCHGSCDLGAIPLVDELTRLKAFLDDEPANVVQLLVEDHAPIAETRAAFEAAGLFDEVYVHAGGAFPTLAALIDDGVRLCHGSCDLGAIPLVDELTRLKAFLDDEPGTVVQLLVEDHAPIVDTRAAFEAAGLFDEVYVYGGGAFPTLRAMIDEGTRLFVTAENQRDDAEPWFHPMFDLVQDTPFTFATVDELTDDASCALNRGAAGHPLFLVNHWLGNPLPDEALADEANAFAVLDDRVRRCAALRDRRVNVVALDFVEVGALGAVVAGLNGLPAPDGVD